MDRLEGRARRMGAAVTALCAVVLAALCFFSAKPWAARDDAAVKAVSIAEETPAPDPMEAFRTEREQLYGMQRMQLEELASGNEEIARAAAEELLSMTRRRETETLLEGILSVKGFSGCLVTVQSDSANVLVRASSLTERQSAAILSVVTSQTGLAAANVKIIPVSS